MFVILPENGNDGGAAFYSPGDEFRLQLNLLFSRKIPTSGL
jgi:hypothetical protein